MKKLTTRLTALLLSGMLVIGSVPGTVFAADAEVGQTSEYAQDVYTEGETAEESSETADAGAEAVEGETAEESSEAAEAAEEEASGTPEENVVDTSEETAAKYYTVTLDANGGYFENELDDAVGEIVEQAEMITRYIPVGGTVPATVVPVFVDPDGQTMLFAGWSLERDGELVITGDEDYAPVGNCILYAVWEAAEAEDAGVADTEQETDVAEESEDSEAVEETESAQEYDSAETAEDTETGSEDTEEVESAQEYEETADEADTAQETAEDINVDSEEYTAPEADNEQDAKSAQDAVYSDAEEEESSDGSVAEEEITPDMVEPSEEEETVKEEAANGVVESGTCGVNGDNLTWTLDDVGTLTISGTGEMYDYSNYSQHYSPWHLNYSVNEVIIKNGVSSIGNTTFYGCSSLTSVTIPNSVTSIGNDAFYDCCSLTSVTIPNSVTSIGNCAFYGCKSLTSVTIPNSVMSIGVSAFGTCSSLTSVTIPNSITSIETYAFYGCSSLTSVTIPNSVTSIGDYSFYGCSSLTSVTIPNSLTSIESYSFYGCSSLTSVTIPNGVSDIGISAFCNCTSLTCVMIPNSVTSIGKDSFSGCSSLTSVTIPNSVSYIGICAFCNCSNLTSVTIPSSVTSLREGAFNGCNSLTSVIIPNSVTSIGDYTFNSCSSLTSVTIPNSVTSIGDYSFYGCSSLKSVTIPNSVTSIGDYSFYGCSSLTSVTIPNSVTSIGDYSFYGCNSLTSVTIPNSVTSIGKAEFYGCNNLTSVTIPNSVISIGDHAFQGCNNLTRVMIPNNVTSIGVAAFQDCSNMTSVTIPNSVTSIGKAAFYGCNSLTSVTIHDNVTSIGSNAFSNCPELIVYTANEYVISYCKSNGFKCNSPRAFYPDNNDTNVDYTLPIKLKFEKDIRANNGYARLYKVGTSDPVKSILLDEEYVSGHRSDFKDLELDFKKNIDCGKNYYITIDEKALVLCDDLSDTDETTETEEAKEYPFSGLFDNEWKFSTVDLDYLPFINPDLKEANDEISEELFEKVFKEEKIAKKYYNKDAYRLPSGICFGMSYVAAAKKNGNTIANQYGKLSLFNSNSYKNKTSGQAYSLLDYIKMAHIYQFTSSLVKEKNKTTKDKYEDIINKIKNNEQVIIHIWEYHIFGTDASHALVPITIIPDNTSTDIKVLVYDCSGVFNTDANRKVFLNTLTFKKNGSKITGFEYNDDTGTNYEHIGINTIDDSLDKLIEGDENSDDIVKFYTENPLIIARNQVDSTALNQVIPSTGVNTENEDGYFYWADGPSFENILAADNIISITNGPNEIEIKANKGASIKLDIENKEAKVENTDASANDYSITYSFYDDDDNTKSIVITGETSSTVNTESTDNGIIVSNEDNTPIEAEISILANDEEVNTVNVTATTNTVNVTCDENNQIEVLEDRDSDGTYETVVATTDGKSIGSAEITGIADKQYTGSAIEHSISVVYDGTELNEGTDYTVAYENNINAGTASVIITGIGDYTGTITKTFTIERAAQQITVSDLSLTLPGTGTISVSGNEGDLTYESDNTDIVEVDASGNLTAKGVGTANITITAEATDNYLEATKTITVTVYIPVYYTVTMDANGGVIIKETDDDTGMEVTNSETVTKRIVEDSYVLIPARHVRNEDDSLLLYGWSLSPGGNPVVTFNEGYKPDGDCTLYAVWKHGTLAGTRLYGDFNDNGIIDSGDALRINRHISANNDASVRSKHPDWIVTGYDYEAADINHDAIISSADVDLVYQCVAAQNSEQTLAEHPDWILTETFDYYSFEDTKPKLVTDITLNNNEIELEIGKTATLTADVIPTDADDASVKWSSSDAEVATVDDNGNVTGVSEGTATITVAACDGSGVYATCDVTVTAPVISIVSITEATVTGISAKTYTGKAITQTPVVKIGDTTLEKDTDYTVAYANNKNAGTATVTITGIGNYEGTITKTFTINPASIAKADVTGIKTKTYTGKALTQVPVVKLGSTTLKRNTDYKLTYKNNTNAGTATVTITGINNYKGSISKTFTINKAAQSLTVKVSASPVTVGKTVTVSVTGAKGKKTYKSSSTTRATVNTSGKVTTKKVGPVKITVTSAATTNYKAASKSINITIRPKPTSITSLTPAKGAVTVKWKKQASQTTGYEIQCSIKSDLSTHKSVIIGKTGTVSKKVTGLKAKTKYYVRIRTYKTVSGTKYYSAWSAVKTVKTK